MIPVAGVLKNMKIPVSGTAVDMNFICKWRHWDCNQDGHMDSTFIGM